MKNFVSCVILCCVTVAAQATALVCTGTLLVACSPNPYAPNPHGFCGERFLESVFVEVQEQRQAPCGRNCGSVLISRGHKILDAQYGIVLTNSGAISVAREIQQNIFVTGTIHRFTGAIGLTDGRSFTFSGNCSSRPKLF